MHTPYQSLALVCEAPGIASEACPEQPGLAWNTIPEQGWWGRGHVEQKAGPNGNSLGFIFLLISLLWNILEIHPQTDKLVGPHLRDGERKARAGLCQGQRTHLSGLYLQEPDASNPDLSPGLRVPWAQQPASARPTLCSDKQIDDLFYLHKRDALLFILLVSLYTTCCRYFHINFVPIKELSPNTWKPQWMSWTNFSPVPPER